MTGAEDNASHSGNDSKHITLEHLTFSHLYRKPPAIDAVFRSHRAIAMAPMKFHLLSFESARQAGTTDIIVVFQKDGNCIKWKERKESKFLNQT